MDWTRWTLIALAALCFFPLWYAAHLERKAAKRKQRQRWVEVRKWR